MDDQTLNRLKLSAVVGGMVFIFFQLFMNMDMFGNDFSVLKLVLAFVLFAVVGGITFVVQGVMNK